jgi:hypothetical protein
VGVELGQLAVVTLAMPVLWLLAASPWRAGRVALAAASIAGTYALRAAAVADRGARAAVLFRPVPLLALTSRRWGYARWVTRLGSVALAALAALWFVEGVSGWSFARGAFG